MYRAEIIVDTDVLDAYHDLLARFPSVLKIAFDRNTRQIRRQLLVELRRPIPPVKYPVQWTSERQRRAFFATDGFGRGIPTQRTGKLQAGWQVSYDAKHYDGAITVKNTVPYERYVTGYQQQGFHKATGWYNTDDILLDYSEKLTDQLITTFFTVTQPEGI